jgi:hypothetical protein
VGSEQDADRASPEVLAKEWVWLPRLLCIANLDETAIDFGGAQRLYELLLNHGEQKTS